MLFCSDKCFRIMVKLKLKLESLEGIEKKLNWLLLFF